MEQLTLEHIAPYLPYGLYGLAEDRTRLDKLLGVYGTGGHSLTMCCRVNNHNTVDYRIEIEDLKPLLRPMDLTTAIIVDGKEVIPIVELAKISFPNVKWYLANDFSCRGLAEDRERFAYRRDLKAFVAAYRGLIEKVEIVPNQIALFQWLAKNKFDYMGLIPLGLAIDVNTLNENPYK